MPRGPGADFVSSLMRAFGARQENWTISLLVPYVRYCAESTFWIWFRYLFNGLYVAE